jgi:hypothetical protein
VFILYALVIGLAAGLLLGGRFDGLAKLRIVWGPLMMAGLMAQLLLFAEPVAARVGDLGVPLYVLSTSLVVVAVLRNSRVLGMPVVAAGALSNLAAIVANGGYMPASPTAMAALGKSIPAVYSNSALVQSPALPWLTDIWALPRWLPGANIFSIGDVLIGVGVAMVIVVAMRDARPTLLAAVEIGPDGWIAELPDGFPVVERVADQLLAGRASAGRVPASRVFAGRAPDGRMEGRSVEGRSVADRVEDRAVEGRSVADRVSGSRGAPVSPASPTLSFGTYSII